MLKVIPSRTKEGRNKELILLIISLVLAVGANLLVSFRMKYQITNQAVITSLILCAVAIFFHILLRKKLPYANQVMLPIVIALNGIGLAIIYQIDTSDSAGFDSLMQVVWTAVGAVVAAVVFWLIKDHRELRKYMYTFMFLGIAFLLLPLIPPFGSLINGAQVWVKIGPLSFQPSEFAKIFLAIFFAGYLVERRATLALAGPKFLGLQLPRMKDLGPMLIVWIASIGVLVFQRDLGTSLLFFGMFVAMLYIATERTSWIVIGMILFSASVFLSVHLFSHVQARFDAWLHPFNPDIYNAVFGGSGQLVQGLFGMSSGGLLGVGWGDGYPAITPYAESDFVYTALGEVLGMTGLLALLALYLFLVEQGIRTALSVRDGFGKLLASGLAFGLALQVFVIVGGVTCVIPLTGLVLPFVAKGGTSLVANWIVFALFMIISNYARRPAEESTISVATGVQVGKTARKAHKLEHQAHVSAQAHKLEHSDSEDGTPQYATSESKAVFEEGSSQ
jgi:cell division protein FtsW (lipid II flippase)